MSIESKRKIFRITDEIQAIENEEVTWDGNSIKRISNQRMDDEKDRVREIIFWDSDNDERGRVFDGSMWEGEFEKRSASIVLQESIPAIETLTADLRDFLENSTLVSELQSNKSNTKYSFTLIWKRFDIKLSKMNEYEINWEKYPRHKVLIDLLLLVLPKITNFYMREYPNSEVFAPREEIRVRIMKLFQIEDEWKGDICFYINSGKEICVHKLLFSLDRTKRVPGDILAENNISIEDIKYIMWYTKNAS